MNALENGGFDDLKNSAERFIQLFDGKIISIVLAYVTLLTLKTVLDNSSDCFEKLLSDCELNHRDFKWN